LNHFLSRSLNRRLPPPRLPSKWRGQNSKSGLFLSSLRLISVRSSKVWGFLPSFLLNSSRKSVSLVGFPIALRRDFLYSAAGARGCSPYLAANPLMFPLMAFYWMYKRPTFPAEWSTFSEPTNLFPVLFGLSEISQVPPSSGRCGFDTSLGCLRELMPSSGQGLFFKRQRSFPYHEPFSFFKILFSPLCHLFLVSAVTFFFFLLTSFSFGKKLIP